MESVVEVSRESQFVELAQQVGEPLRRYVVRRVAAADVDDVLAEVFLVIWRRLGDVPVEHALPWTYGVARNCVANARRSEQRRLRLVAKAEREPRDEPPPEDPALAEALAQLGATDQELLRLWAWEQLTPTEIAAATGLTANAVSIRLSRARQRLRHLLRKESATAGQEQGETTRGGRADV